MKNPYPSTSRSRLVWLVVSASAMAVLLGACSEEDPGPVGAADASALDVAAADTGAGADTGGSVDSGNDGSTTDADPPDSGPGLDALADSAVMDADGSVDVAADSTTDLDADLDAAGADTSSVPFCGKGTVQGFICTPGTLNKIGNAKVSVKTVGCDGEELYQESITTALGAFKLVNVPKGVHRIDVESPQYTGWFYAQINAGAVTLQSNFEECGKEKPTSACGDGTLRGNICPPGSVSYDSAGVHVWLEAVDCSGSTHTYSSTSTSSGDFQMLHVPNGTHWLYVDVDADGDEDNGFAPWAATVKVEADTLNDIGQIGGIMCQGVPALPSQGSVGGGGDLGQVCTDPKWNLCGQEILEYCLTPEPPFPDCNNDGVPDPCPSCPKLEVVFAIDTSGSMSDELSALCQQISEMVAKLNAADIETESTVLGMGGTISCANSTVFDEFGATIPNPPASWTPMGGGDCGDMSEDWARATAVIAANKNWTANSVRVVIPISDEGPYCGDPVDAKDEHFTDIALGIALEYSVIVSPIAGNGTMDDVASLGKKLALLSGGTWAESTNANEDIADIVIYSALDACSTFSDCNQNAIPDDCDIAAGKLTDANGDSIADECQ